MSDFWQFQTKESQERYVRLLQTIGGLSNLFSDSNTPFLYYRAHENLFCEVFDAKNLSRGDISYDALKYSVGVGLKTFLQQNGQTFQKVAEFNAESDSIRALESPEEIAYRVATLRNKRLELTKNLTDSKDAIYHLITRQEGRMNIVETAMDYVDLSTIRLPKRQSKNTIKFNDRFNEYSFSLSKNTLLKRFNTLEENILFSFDVSILDNPFELLEAQIMDVEATSIVDEMESIILPLYSVRKQEVSAGSGLNQWNAGGRQRDPDEVYIPIPSWIHHVFNDFFIYSRERTTSTEPGTNYPPFELELPNGKVLSAKIAQSGGKALMSNPNKDLGHWLLREVLKVPYGQLVTLDMLYEVGIDSVKVTKKNDNYYYLDFMGTGSYEEFEGNNL